MTDSRLHSGKLVMIMAGGTGGHIYPALAVAEYLQQRGIQIIWLGTSAGLEARVVPDNGYPLLTINISGVRGKGVFRWLFAPLAVCFALYQAMLMMMRYKPAVVLGMGGFVSAPGGIASRFLRIPLCIHEQNAVAGLTNRFLARFASITMQSFPDTFASKNVYTTGNPVRKNILDIPLPQQRFRGRDSKWLRILVLGGSLGAMSLNKVVLEVLLSLRSDAPFRIQHQTGKQHFSWVKEQYCSTGISVDVHAYLEDMAAAYSWADVVLCRAGATTIAELTAAGIAAILVPFPYAVDDHQTTNARYLSDNKAAILVADHALDRQTLVELLYDFYSDRERLLKMAIKARALANPQAAKQVGDICLEAAYG